jgi:hypothetical protein
MSLRALKDDYRRRCLRDGVQKASRMTALLIKCGLGCGLNAMPKRSFLSEYSSRITPQKVSQLLAGWHGRCNPLVPSLLLLERRRQQGRGARGDLPLHQVLDAAARQAAEAFVFDSKLTTFEGLDRLDEQGIIFITLRRRSPALLKVIENLAPSAWRTVALDVPHRKYRTPRVYEQKARPRLRTFRQFFIEDLGHDEPTILLTNDRRSTAVQLITRYAKRIKNALADAVHFFHFDALSSSVGLKVDFDIALLVIASGLYRLMAKQTRGYNDADAQARQIFRDLINMSADVAITDRDVTVRFHRRAHLPIVLDSDLFKKTTPVPWWNGLPLCFVE